MIQDKSYIETWRKLLDETIPREMAGYQQHLAAGAKPNHHANAAQQCRVWVPQLSAFLGDAVKLAAFQTRYADWTTVNLQAVLSSLQAIQAAIRNYQSAPNATNLVTIHSALNSSLA